ncbi:class I SAM-dependent methyltransferase [Streptomyces sp. NPDC052496]|uniref:class I SAM-dependent methyltransferase n=1 Tax=Streptomyces sp. NPDC052496 TaxID=3154951 RepID=UPI00343F1DB3
MTALPHRLLRALDRFNAAHPWDHNAHFHPWILRQLPRRFGSALDVGSGSGDLAALLATRAATVHGIDADPAITARAREAVPRSAPVTFTVADALTGIPGDSYDVITCVAVLHHLPLADALTVFRRHLAPGGTLVIVGLAREQSPADRLLAAASVPLNVATGWFKNRGRTREGCPDRSRTGRGRAGGSCADRDRTARRPVAMTAPARPADLPFSVVLREAHRILPGARLRRRLFWRYTLVWRHP